MNTPENMRDSRAIQAAGILLNFRFFLDYQPGKNSSLTSACLSQWWPCLFTVERNTFTTAEHFMMHQKAVLFGDHVTAARILDADHPFEAKTLGRRVRNFDEARWNTSRFDIVVQGSIAKFSQNPNLLNFLLATGDDILAEASPTDLIWGTGCREEDPAALHPENWPGQNLLGFALIQARDQVRQKVAPEKPSLIPTASH